MSWLNCVNPECAHVTAAHSPLARSGHKASTPPQGKMGDIPSISVSLSFVLYCQSPLSTTEAKKQTNEQNQIFTFLPASLVPVAWNMVQSTERTKEKSTEGLLRNVFSTLKTDTERKCSPVVQGCPPVFFKMRQPSCGHMRKN